MKNLLILLSISLILASCKPKNDCKAGSGGNLVIKASTVHHTRLVPGCTVYVKYNANEFPGTDFSVYEVTVKAKNDESFVTIPGLKCGNYDLYAQGIDSLLSPVNWIVKGGIPFSTSQDKDTISISIPITEGD
jgi:hypothetical protein